MQMAYDKETPMYAGFFIRLAAFLIDMLLVNLVLCIIRVPVGFLKLTAGDAIIFHNVLFRYDIFDILYYVLTVTYFVLATYYSGKTVGKHVMRIRVISTQGGKPSFLDILMRETIGRYLSSVVIYIGYIIAGLDHRKQGIHDRIGDTYVVYAIPDNKRMNQPAIEG